MPISLHGNLAVCHRRRTFDSLRATRTRRGVIGIVVCCLASATTGAPLRSSWQCLPDEAVVAVRVPDGQALSQAMQKTKLGKVMFNKDRVEQAKQMLIEQDSDQWEVLNEGLAEYGLSMDDLPTLLSGESGAAVLVDGVGADAIGTLLAWVEPGEDLAQRMMVAIDKLLEEHEGDEEPPQRVDVEIEGQLVMHLTLPNETQDKFQISDDFGGLNEQQQQEIFEKFQEQSEGERRLVYQQFLVTRIEGRLLMSTMLEPADAGEVEALGEHVTKVFGRFLAAHGDDDGGFVARVADVAGVATTLPPDGVTAFELIADLRPLVGALSAQPVAGQVVKMLRFDQLGAAAFRAALDGSMMRTGAFIEATSPRSGLMALLDQPKLSPEPPAWVPADLVSYSHTSADLGKIYAGIKNMVLKEYGSQAEQGFQQIEAMTKMYTQADLATVLSSLGERHIVLSYESEIRLLEDNPTAGMQPDQRMAIVWQIKDDAIWTNLLQMVAAFAAGQGGLEPADEQGFTGWRLKQQNIEGGLVRGNGFLVFALGQGVLELTLSALNAPPKGKAALLSSEMFKRVQAMIDLRPGQTFQVMDGNRYARMVRKMLSTALDQMAKINEAVPAEQLRLLLPSEQEFEGVLGAAGGFAEVTDDGLVIVAVNELPVVE